MNCIRLPPHDPTVLERLAQGLPVVLYVVGLIQDVTSYQKNKEAMDAYEAQIHRQQAWERANPSPTFYVKNDVTIYEWSHNCIRWAVSYTGRILMITNMNANNKWICETDNAKLIQLFATLQRCNVHDFTMYISVDGTLSTLRSPLFREEFVCERIL